MMPVFLVALVMLIAVATVILVTSGAKADEREALRALALIADVNARFHAGDLDQNGIKDYWTGDVASLYERGLIPMELALADARPIRPLAKEPVPFRGYLFLMMEGEEGGEDWRVDTDGKGEKVHHKESFGLCAYPAPYRKGQITWLVRAIQPYRVGPDGKIAPMASWSSVSGVECGGAGFPRYPSIDTWKNLKCSKTYID